jgi:vacuolar-type H+-ATPase subunit F/Vma7
MSKDKRLTAKEMQERDTLAIMGDEDSVTGFLIAGMSISCTTRINSMFRAAFTPYHGPQ